MADAPIDTSADTPKDVNGRSIWPFWARNAEWREKVNEQMVRKSLDLPSDDVNITQNKSGITTGGAVALAAAAGVPSTLAAGIMGASMLFGGNGNTANSSAEVVTQPQAAVAPVNPADSEYEVRFYDKDGNPIVVPHISTRPKTD